MGKVIRKGSYVWHAGSAWLVIGRVGKKNLIQRQIEYFNNCGVQTHTDTIRKIRSSWRLRKLGL